jgi:hypothetical protein
MNGKTVARSTRRFSRRKSFGGANGLIIPFLAESGQRHASLSSETSMSLETWAKNGWPRPHKITRQEIVDLLGVVERDLKDAQRDLSADWKFGIAYNAALQLCTILLNASGYRPEKLQAHYRPLQSLPLMFTRLE